MTESGNSLVTNSNLISKVYFPRLVIIVSSVITSFVDFLISAAFVVLLMIWYRFPPPPAVLLLPFFVLLAFGASLGVCLWIAALMVEYRDFRFIVPFHGPVRTLYLASRIPEQRRARTFSPPIRAQSDGGNH